MIKGESVTVLTPTDSTPDRFGNVTKTWTQTTVDNVLIIPGATEDLESSRPEGVSVAFTLHFPKTFTQSLEGCRVELSTPYTGIYDVVGCPAPYMDANTPTLWHTPVEIGAAHG